VTFTPEVYEQIREGAQRSAAAVVPTVYDLVKPSTVVDVGGGEGWWGRAFYDLGASVMVADETFEEWRFETDSDHRLDLMPCDLLEPSWAARLADERLAISDTHGGSPDFDLAVCLEVGEHLPPEQAEALVEGLCQLAPVVLFSAAIPNQGGHGHVNEQWPDYWATLFADKGYSCTDFLRWEFWNDERVEPWYRQNMLLFGQVEFFSEKLQRVEWHLSHRAVVHPDIYGWRVAERDRLTNP
jgi:hypothetical protein